VIGVLRASSATQYDPAMDAIRAGLQALGYAPGQNIRIEQRFANRRAKRLPALAAELVDMQVRVIVAVNEASLRAAMRATSTIPIVVIAYDHDPVAAGLIDSVNRPGGNVTGIFSRQTEFAAKRLELLKQTLPELTRVAVLHQFAGAKTVVDLEAAGTWLGLHLDFIELKNPTGFESAVSRARKQTRAALLLFSPTLFDYRLRLATLVRDNDLALMTQEHEFTVAGALMSFAPDRAEIAARLAYSIDRLLRGARPSDLPVEEATKFELSVNLKTAKALRVEIPQTVLPRADEVVK
jgi:putative ABC transport system substrate-binding protein